MKVCSRCKEEKDESCFNKMGTGLRPECTDCRKKASYYIPQRKRGACESCGDPTYRQDAKKCRSCYSDDLAAQPIKWRKDRHGYMVATKNGVYLAQHREVMKVMLGRDLLPGENVHHKNGKRDDNRQENLELWVTFQPQGQRPEDLLAWADEINRRYR